MTGTIRLALAVGVLLASSACAAKPGYGDATSDPLIGTWREKAPTACQTATEDTRSTPLDELVFEPGGKFSVTWMPFETYKDYWGTYSYDPASEALTLKVSGGNYVPTDARLRGRAHVANGTLEISDTLFGQPHAPPAHTSTCPLLFAK